MKISNQQIASLLRMVALTRDDEVTCDECLEQMAEFAERSLTGKSISDGLQCIEHHLEICGECLEEFAALKTALTSETWNDGSEME